MTILKNKEGHILPLSEINDLEEFTLTLDNGMIIHNKPIERKIKGE